MSKADQPANTPSPKSSELNKGLMVLGMHRSGTSACTRVLNLLGCALPPELIDAGDGNETGHWESSDAVNLNDEMLALAGSRWDDWGPVNSDWRRSPLRDEMVARASDVVANHARLGPLFALKDPRLCRLADVWLSAMKQARVESLVVLMLRNPAEVAESLENRDLMSQGYGRLLWLRHVLDAEHFTRGQRRAICTYDQLMDNWYAMIDRIKADLGVILPRNSPTAHAEVDAFLDGQHRHYRQSPTTIIDNPSLSDWLRRTYAVMLAWSETGEAASDHAELDAIRLEFDRSYAAFARLLIERDVAGEVGSGSQLKRQLVVKLAEAQGSADAARATVEVAEARLKAQAAHEAELALQLEAYASQATKFEAEIEHLRAESKNSSALASDLEALRAREGELERQIAEQLVASEVAQGEADRLKAEVARLGREAEGADARKREIAALRMQEADLNREIEKLHDALRSAAEKNAAMSADIMSLMAESKYLSKSAEEASSLRTRQIELAVEIAELKAALAVARGDAAKEQRTAQDMQAALEIRNVALDRQYQLNAEMKGQLSVAQSTAAQRDEELAQLWKQLLAAEKASGVAEASLSQERGRREVAEKHQAEAEDNLAALCAQHDSDLETASMESEQMAAEVAFMTRLLRQQTEVAATAQDALTSANKDIEILTEKLHRIESEVRSAEAGRWSVEKALSNRFDEAARLTFMVSEDAKAKALWLRDVVRVSERFPKWWALLPAGWRLKREHARYRRHELFDSEQYLANNPDVLEFGMDPIRHYILHGIDEGRTWQR